MSCSIDVNILLIAINVDEPRQTSAQKLLDRLAGGREPLYLAWQTVFGFVRMATHPGILKRPVPTTIVHDAIQSLLGAPTVQVITEQDGFWDVYREVTQGLVVRGRQVPDAQLAALLRQHGVKKLYTTDPDFKRFAFLDVENPL